MEDNYCYHLYKSMYIFPQSEDKVLLAPCCHYPGDPADASDVISINHPVFENNRRLAKETGELPDHVCHNCTDREKRGLESTREIAEEKFQGVPRYTKELMHLSYVTYTHCNLACIHCSPLLSSTWALEVDKYYGIKTDTRKTKNAFAELNIDFENVGSMLLSGGEPLLNKETVRALAETHKSLFRLILFTNGTTPISDEILGYIKHIPDVTLNISIDGVQDGFEYIRWPGKWADLVQFHDRLVELDLPNVSVKHITNIGVQNIHRIHEVLNFSKERDIESVIWNTDGILNIKYLPADAITPKLTDIINSIPDPQKKDEVWKNADRTGSEVSWEWVGYLDQLDIMRNTNWRETMKDLWESVKHYPEAHFDPDKLHIHHAPGSQNQYLEEDLIPTVTI